MNKVQLVKVFCHRGLRGWFWNMDTSQAEYKRARPGNAETVLAELLECKLAVSGNYLCHPI